MNTRPPGSHPCLCAFPAEHEGKPGKPLGGPLERVPASREQADNLLAQASNHLAAAEATVAIDAVGAYQLLYDAARRALVAVLENQGLRPISRGGHIAVLEAVGAQLDPPLGTTLKPFDRMRCRRNQAEFADQVPEGLSSLPSRPLR